MNSFLEMIDEISEENKVKVDLDRVWEVYHELEKNWPEHGVYHPLGAYGWDNVAKWQKLIDEANTRRQEAIMKSAVEIVVNEVKLSILKADDRSLEIDNGEEK